MLDACSGCGLGLRPPSALAGPSKQVSRLCPSGSGAVSQGRVLDMGAPAGDTPSLKLQRAAPWGTPELPDSEAGVEFSRLRQRPGAMGREGLSCPWVQWGRSLLAQ